MRLEGWLAVGAALIAILALALVETLWRRQAELRSHPTFATPGVPTPPVVDHVPLVAVVANPSKPDAVELREKVEGVLAERSANVLWLTTTVSEPGTRQAHQALAAGADLVIAAGGDGTVRAVARAMTTSRVPMGILPTGTGNLLARNLDLPLTDPLAALAVALDGSDKAIDVGRLRVLRWGPDGAVDDEPEQVFLVIAGLGFDAAMVADVDAALKAKVGWMAYFLAGIRHLHGSRQKVRLRLDKGTEVQARVRSLLIGNCGRLPGGLTLLPDALIDDGWLDLAAIDTRGGLAGWAQLFGEVVLQGAGIRTELPSKIGRIEHARARRVHLEVVDSATVQADGDVAELAAWVEPGALLVRVP